MQHSRKFTNYYGSLLVGSVIAALLLTANIQLAKGKPYKIAVWVAECLAIKDNAVNIIDPTLVIVSGSNGLFGFSAERLTKVHKIRSVNAAIHAGLGIDYTLHYARRYFKPGRVLVLPLEYEQYAKSSSGPTYIFQALIHDPDYFDQLSIVDKIKFVGNTPISVHSSLLKNMIVASDPPKTGYDSETLNKYGDETDNDWSNDEKHYKITSLASNAQVKATRIFTHDEHAWHEIEKFSEDARNSGTTVILAHPNKFDQSISLERNRNFFKEMMAHASKIGITVVGQPKDRLFNTSRIYDTHYHQNSLGQKMSTDILFQQLQEAGVIST